MILTVVAVILFIYFPRLRYAVLEGDRNYGDREKDGVVQRVSLPPSESKPDSESSLSCLATATPRCVSLRGAQHPCPSPELLPNSILSRATQGAAELVRPSTDLALRL